jgi:hypothetical protein
MTRVGKKDLKAPRTPGRKKPKKTRRSRKPLRSKDEKESEIKKKLAASKHKKKPPAKVVKAVKAVKARKKTKSSAKAPKKTKPPVKVTKAPKKTRPSAKAPKKTKPSAKAPKKTRPSAKAPARAPKKTKPSAKAPKKTKPSAKAFKKPPIKTSKPSKKPPVKAVKRLTKAEIARLRAERAKKSALFYASKLGKRKAAARLKTTVATFERWLEKGFPEKKIDEAIGLSRVGGSFTTIKKIDLGKLKKKLSGKKLAALTGLPESEIDAQIKLLGKKPARLRVRRDVLKKLKKKLGEEKLSELFGIKTKDLQRAQKIPQTILTRRLSKLVDRYEAAGIASMLGVSESTVKRWISTNVPRKWESEVVGIIGRQPDQGVSEEKLIKPRRKRDLAKEFKEAWKRSKRFNERVEASYRVPRKTVERWVRIGKFSENFEKAKAIYAGARKTVPTYELPPEPPRPPGPPEPQLFAKPLPPLPPPPKGPKVPQVITEVEKEAIRDFNEARAEAFFKGIPDEHRPPDAWERPKFVELINRKGFRVFKKTEEFCHLVNMGKLGNEIIAKARKIWKKISGRNEYMTIRFTFSACGTGNPFYPEAWFPDDNTFSFFTRSSDVIYEDREIDYRVRSILNEIWDVTKEIGLLFLEHYEIIKSVAKL